MPLSTPLVLILATLGLVLAAPTPNDVVIQCDVANGSGHDARAVEIFPRCVFRRDEAEVQCDGLNDSGHDVRAVDLSLRCVFQRDNASVQCDRSLDSGNNVKRHDNVNTILGRDGLMVVDRDTKEIVQRCVFRQ